MMFIVPIKIIITDILLVKLNYVTFVKLILFTMINSDQFAERLRAVMDFYQLTASQFADKIDVQKSSISHLLSGRNKPSLEFVMKVIKSFDEVELYWLLNGKGVFPKPSNTEEGSSPILNQKLTQKKLPDFSESSNSIERIVIFFKDGTFKAYQPSD